jgi:hypothetical protein
MAADVVYFTAGLIAVQWSDPADDARINTLCVEATAEIKKQTTKLGLYVDFVYLNDAGASQKPYSTYGGGKSLPRLKRIQNKYDPEHFLEKYLAHGFGLES